MTKEALEALGDTLSFTEIWLELLDNNYDSRQVAYITATKDMFKQIPTTMTKAIIPKQKVQKLMTEIGGGWYTGEFLREYQH